MDVMETLVKHVRQVSFDDLPSEVVSITKRSVIDTIGAMIAGSSVDGSKLLIDYVHDWGGRPESTVAVFGGKVPSALAAQANGAMARALEIDDIIDIFPLHPSASVIPTCLAIAERQGAVNGKDFITAIALGHDLVVRLALSIKLSPVVSGRYNLFKIFAFTGAAGKLLGLTEAQLVSAMGISYSQMVGDAQAQADGVMMSYIQQGTRAKSAIEAALMAQAGITGTRNVLQGQRGFYNAYEPDPNLPVLTEGLGKRFRGEDLSIKLHSACRFTHQPIDLVQMFLSDGITADQVDSVIVRVADECYSLVCEPLVRKRKPSTHVDAQFSIPFTTAATFVRGDVFIDEINEHAINDPEILKLAQRITPVADSALKTELVVGSVIMEVKTKSGQTLVKQTQFPRGNPRNPVTLDECVEKFWKCAAYSANSFPKKQLDQIIEMVSSLERVDDINKLAELLIPG
jgi:2-methylcitrate dehydratase PrpD